MGKRVYLASGGYVQVGVVEINTLLDDRAVDEDLKSSSVPSLCHSAYL